MTNLQAIDLLKGLEQSLDDYCELNDEGKTAFGMAITALELFGNSEQLTSAQPEQRWISCSERLPETSGSYLVSGVWASGRVAVGDCEYSSYDGYFDTAWNFDVLAWMPLPEPYREDIE